jgi:hypothetical protein
MGFRYLIIILITTFGLTNCLAQTPSKNLKDYLPDEILPFRPDFGLDGTNTIIKGYGMGLGGIKLGIRSVKYHYKIGLSYQFTVNKITENTAFLDTTFRTQFLYTSLSGYFEYPCYRDKKFDVFGGGKLGVAWTSDVLRAEKSNLGATKLNVFTFGILEPYISATYKITPLLGLSGGLGYRIGIFSPSWAGGYTAKIGFTVDIKTLIKLMK